MIQVSTRPIKACASACFRPLNYAYSRFFFSKNLSMSDKITLYDLATRSSPSKGWSYNVWKARLVFAYKGVPYTTSWVDHNTLKLTLQSLGVPRNTSGQGLEYTVPTIKLPDGAMLTDSAAIARKIDSLHPSPPLHFDATFEAEVQKAVFAASKPLFANYMPRVAREVIPEDTIPAFSASRQKMFGMPLEEVDEKLGGEKAWKAAEPGFKAMAALLKEHKRDGGPFVLGSAVSYADFMIVSAFISFRRVDEGWFQRMVAMDKVFADLYEVCEGWTEKDQ